MLLIVTFSCNEILKLSLFLFGVFYLKKLDNKKGASIAWPKHILIFNAGELKVDSALEFRCVMLKHMCNEFAQHNNVLLQWPFVVKMQV